MARRSRNQNKGCFSNFKVLWNILFFGILLFLIGFNITFSNIIGETCGFIHPIIFVVDASVVDDSGDASSIEYPRFPFNEEEVELFFEFERDYRANRANVTGETDDSQQADAGIDTYLRIYDADGDTLLAENDDDPQNVTLDSAIRRFGLESATEILIEVGTYADDNEGGFTLRVEPVDGNPVPPLDSRPERIDNIFDPEIELNNAGDQIEDVIFADERIVYTMPVEAGQSYNIFLESNSAINLIDENELDTYLRVYDESGTQILAENDDNDFSFGSTISDFGVEETQTVIVEVGTFFDELIGDYVLIITPVSGDFFNDPQDPENEDFAIVESSTTFDTDGGSAEGAINDGERIRYRFTVEGGQAYQIDVSGFNAFSDEELPGEEIPRGEQITADNAFSLDQDAASRWPRCLEYFGYVSDGNYIMNENGLIWFLDGTEAADKLFDTCAESTIPREYLEQCVRASIRLSGEARMFFFVLLAILVVSLPIFIVDALEGQREIIWYIFLMMVVVQATTTAMLFLHLGQVSGIGALEEFGYGIFGGITTGAALVFIDKIASRAEDNEANEDEQAE